MPLAPALLVYLLLGLACSADDTRLIPAGATWKYFKGVTEPAGEFGAWRLSDYNDASWSESMSGFSTSAYVPEPGYLIDYGFNYRTLYVRKRFGVVDPKSLRELTLRVDYDDGFIAYLNGREIARRGVPGPVDQLLSVTNFASFHLRGTFEEVNVSPALSLIRAGENVLAVQVFGSGSLDYTFAFVPELLGNFTRGPFLQNTTSNSTQIIFKTLSAANSFVELEGVGRLPLSGADTNHVSTLTNLTPNTEYTYRVGAMLNGGEVVSDSHRFRTLKTGGGVTFAVLGDSGSGSLPQYQIAAQMRAAAPDLIMHVGDLIYYAITSSSADFRLLSVYADQLFSTPMFVAFGNHDFYLSPTAALETFYLPTNQANGSELFYSFDHGDVHFAVAWSDLQAYADYRPGSVQYNWLDNDLARSSKPWKFLFFHHVWRSSGPHGDDDYDLNNIEDSVQLDEGLAALAKKHGVQVIFNGHDHGYERFTPKGGVLSFVTGGGGTILYPPARIHPDSVEYEVRHEFLKVNVDGESALIEAVGTDGVVFDRVHLQLHEPLRQPQASGWNSPAFARDNEADEDNDGPDEAFELVGPPVQGKMATSSSVGRLFVNNDNHNLYVGLDEVMLHDGDEVFVFLETSPKETNRTVTIDDLTASSVGVVTNSLLRLGGLVFTNFSPSVGMVLGDDLGDGGYMNFLRKGWTNNTGQGAFQLQRGLPLVPGQHLQQFDGSPGTVRYEGNANLIQVSLPLEKINAQPGERIKIAAVVGLDEFETNYAGLAQRSFDSGLGWLTHSGDKTYLEPLEFQLEVNLDPDDDGLTNAQEFALGTNPENPDSDGDGMPDGWELSFGFRPLDKDGDSDVDGDGLSNGAEFIAGTNPRDGNSRLTLTAVHRPSAIEIRWKAVPGKSYMLQARETLLGPFRDVTSLAFSRVATRTTEAFMIPVSPATPMQYFRIAVLNQ